MVISVDYRLSPEHLYPAHLDDVEAAYRWALTQPILDPTRLAVGGDSAGGNLVAGLLVRLQSSDVPPEHRPMRTALIYPALDLTMSSGESYHKYAAGYGLSIAAMNYFIAAYLGPDHESLAQKPEVSPLLVSDWAMYPPTLLISAEADPLFSDAESLASTLTKVGIPVKHVVYPGVVHAFIQYHDIFPEAGLAVGEIVAYLKEAWWPDR